MGQLRRRISHIFRRSTTPRNLSERKARLQSKENLPIFSKMMTIDPARCPALFPRSERRSSPTRGNLKLVLRLPKPRQTAPRQQNANPIAAAVATMDHLNPGTTVQVIGPLANLMRILVCAEIAQKMRLTRALHRL